MKNISFTSLLEVFKCHFMYIVYSACNAREWKCPTTGVCIPQTAFCDGTNDCPEGEGEDEDEYTGCAAGAWLASSVKAIVYQDT